MNHQLRALITVTAASLAGCSAAGTDDPTSEVSHNQPAEVEDSDALTAETDDSEGLITELKVGDAVIQFYEYEPGEVGVAAGFPIDGTPPAMPGESLVEIFKAADPTAEVPIQLIEADERVAQMRALMPDDDDTAPANDLIDLGTPPEAIEVGGNIGKVSQPLVSSIGWGWFQDQYCNGWGSASHKFPWCFEQAFSWAWAEAKRKNARAVACGDTGAGIMKAYKNGRLKKSLTIGYSLCWWYAFWGNKVIRRFSLREVQQSLRFAGMMHDSEFIVAPPGWLD